MKIEPNFSQQYITMCRMAEEITDHNMIRQEGCIKYYNYATNGSSA